MNKSDFRIGVVFMVVLFGFLIGYSYYSSEERRIQTEQYKIQFKQCKIQSEHYKIQSEQCQILLRIQSEQCQILLKALQTTQTQENLDLISEELLRTERLG